MYTSDKKQTNKRTALSPHFTLMGLLFSDFNVKKFLGTHMLIENSLYTMTYTVMTYKIAYMA